MSSTLLPPTLLNADQALHSLHARVHFFRHLNPVNAPQARMAFRSGEKVPPFQYLPTIWADDELRTLDALCPSQDHPFGVLLAQAIHGTRLFILALRDRSPLAFDALARFNGWYPSQEELKAAREEPFGRDLSPSTIGAQAMIRALREALSERGLEGWRVDLDTVMSARVLVDGAKREIKVRPGASFRRQDVPRLVAHEIEVHATRASNGAKQALRLFSTGLPGSLATEEGLALYAEEQVGASSPGTAWRQGVVLQAVEWARELGFFELHQRIAREAGPGLAWGISERLKRGLADPGAPGVYAKDVVYYQGYRRVTAWIAAENPMPHLYVGKVGVEHPVQQWLDQGLITPQPVPALFAASGSLA